MDLQLFKPFQSAGNNSQTIFRQLLKCMSEPGYIETITSDAATESTTIYDTTWAVAQALLDADCQVAVLPSLNEQKMIQSLQFFTDCTVEEKQANDKQYSADFAFLSVEELDQLECFKTGSLEAPHESCTLIVQTIEISQASQLTLTGPGIKTQWQLSIAGLTHASILKLQNNHALYPCGIDIIFCSPTQITALPRSTSITVNQSLQEIA